MTEKQDIRKLFFKEKPVETIINIYNSEEESYSLKIRDEIDTTYAHITKILKEMEKMGIIQREEQGRKKIIKLTSEGKIIAENLEQAY